MRMSYYPVNLKGLPIWILWQKIQIDNKTGKIPYSAIYEGKASSNNPDSWTTFEDAFSVYLNSNGSYNGVGIAITKRYKLIFIDIDHCIDEEGNINEIGQDILQAFGEGTYVERSQSGRGIHILTAGEISKSYKNSENGVEIYDSGRFCAMTGDVIVRQVVEEVPGALEYVYNKYKKPDPPKHEHRGSAGRSSKPDAWIKEKAMQDGKTSLLMEGRWNAAGYKSQSEADLALCSKLAFWSDADPVQVERIFRSSGLYRDKWDRAQYSQMTVAKACSEISETYSEYTDRKRREEAKRLGRDRYFTIGSE